MFRASIAAAIAAFALGACSGGGGTTPTAGGGGMTPTPAPTPAPTPVGTPGGTLGGPPFYDRPSGVYHTQINCTTSTMGHAPSSGECLPRNMQGRRDFPSFTALSPENVEKIKSGTLLYQHRDYSEPDGTGELAASAPDNWTDWSVTRTYAALDGHWQAVTDSNFRGRAAAAGMDLQTALIEGAASAAASVAARTAAAAISLERIRRSPLRQPPAYRPARSASTPAPAAGVFAMRARRRRRQSRRRPAPAPAAYPPRVTPGPPAPGPWGGSPVSKTARPRRRRRSRTRPPRPAPPATGRDQPVSAPPGASLERSPDPRPGPARANSGPWH